MDLYINSNGEKNPFKIPRSWNLMTSQDKPPLKGILDVKGEIQKALDHPIGSPKLYAGGLF